MLTTDTDRCARCGDACTEGAYCDACSWQPRMVTVDGRTRYAVVRGPELADVYTSLDVASYAAKLLNTGGVRRFPQRPLGARVATH